MQLKTNIIGLFLISVFIGCDLFESNDDLGDTDVVDKVYVALQGLDKIGIVNINSEVVEEIDINYHSVDCSGFNNVTDCANNGCMWHDMGEMNSHCMSHGDSNTNNAPHFISIDYTHRYWFVTAMMSGWVGRYSLNTGDLIDIIFVGDSPALMAIDENKQILYVSRMMLMEDGQHGAQTSFIQTIDYSDPEKMVFKEPLDATIQGPHAVAINSDGSELYTATFEGDWLYKFMLEENTIGDMEVFNQWSDKYDYTEYDIILITHDDNFILSDSISLVMILITPPIASLP